MPFEDFKGFWKVRSTGEDAKCAINSLITFDQTNDEVTVLCAVASFPYGEATGKYKKVVDEEGNEVDTIEVTLEGKTYVISMNGTPEKRQIKLDLKSPGRELLTGSWTAEDYVPAPPPPTGK
jgi:hypothetical protein